MLLPSGKLWKSIKSICHNSSTVSCELTVDFWGHRELTVGFWSHRELTVAFRGRHRELTVGLLEPP